MDVYPPRLCEATPSKVVVGSLVDQGRKTMKVTVTVTDDLVGENSATPTESQLALLLLPDEDAHRRSLASAHASTGERAKFMLVSLKPNRSSCPQSHAPATACVAANHFSLTIRDSLQ